MKPSGHDLEMFRKCSGNVLGAFFERRFSEFRFRQQSTAINSNRHAATSILRPKTQTQKSRYACAIPAFSQRCRETPSRIRPQISGRGERIRTSDSCVPNAVLYQAELRPDFYYLLFQATSRGAQYRRYVFTATATAFRFEVFAAVLINDFVSDLYSPRKRRILTENFEKGKWGRSTGLGGPGRPRPRRPGGRVPGRPWPGWRRPRRRSRRRPS